MTQVDYSSGGRSSFSYYYPSNPMTLEYDIDCYDEEFPCKKSELFDSLGRDPYFINMVTARRIYDEADQLVKYDSLRFWWLDEDSVGYISSGDTFYTHRLVQGNSSVGAKQYTHRYRYYTELGPYSLDTRDRGWVLKQMSVVEFDGEDTLRSNFSYWNSGTKLMDSSRTVTDGLAATESYVYNFLDEDLNYQQENCLESQYTTNALGIRTETYYNLDFLDVDYSTDYYNNAIADSTRVERSTDSQLLAKSANFYYDDTSSGGYPGQLQRSVSYEVENGAVADSFYQKYEYLKGVVSPTTLVNGALKKKISPDGDSVFFHYAEEIDTSTVPDESLFRRPPDDKTIVVSPATYYQWKWDGSISEVTESFENRKSQQWYKMVSFNGEDSLLYFRKINAFGNPVLLVGANGFGSAIEYDDLQRVTQITLPGSWSVAAPPPDSMFIDPSYDAEDCDFEIEFDPDADTITSSWVYEWVETDECVWEERKAHFEFAGIDFSDMYNANIDSAFIDLYCLRTIDADTMMISGFPSSWVYTHPIDSGYVRYDVTEMIADWAEENPALPRIQMWPKWTPPLFAFAPSILDDEITVSAYASGPGEATRYDIVRKKGLVTWELRVLDCLDCKHSEAEIYNQDTLIDRIVCNGGTHTGSFVAELGDLITVYASTDCPEIVARASFTHYADAVIVKASETSTGYNEASDTIDVAADIPYTLFVPDDGGAGCSGVSYAAIYHNSAKVDSVAFTGSSITVNGSIAADSGDVITVVAAGDCVDLAPPGIYAEFVHYPFVYPIPAAIFASSEDSEPEHRPVLSIYYPRKATLGNSYTIRYEYDDTRDDGDGISVTKTILSGIDTYPRTTRTWFDGLRRPVQTDFIDSSGTYDSVMTAYDFADRVTTSIDQLGNATTYSYDILDRSRSSVFPSSLSIDPRVTTAYITSSGTIFGTDYDLYAARMTDENDHQTTSYADLLDQNRKTRTSDGTNFVETYFDYDDLGNLTAVLRPMGDTVLYDYNSLGWLLEERSPDYGTILYQYDCEGKLDRRQDANAAAMSASDWWLFIEYDDINRVTAGGRFDSTTETADTLRLFFYDQESSANSIGRLSISLSTQDADDYGEQYDYDGRGRLVRQKNIFYPDLLEDDGQYQLIPRVDGGLEYEIEYEYNRADQLTALTYPDDMVVTYYYDDRGRLQSVGDDVDEDRYASFEYTARDEIETMTLGGLQYVDYLYNERGWLTSINNGQSAVPGGGDLFGQEIYYYSHPDFPDSAQYNGNIVGQKISIGGEETYTYLYSYDKLDRLLSVYSDDDQATIEQFAYDLNSNRLQYIQDDIGTRDYYYITGTNRIDSIAGSKDWLCNRYNHDANGNVTFDSSKDATLRYDIYNQLDTVTFAKPLGTDITAFGYNNAGERVTKSHYWHYSYLCGGGGSIPASPVVESGGGPPDGGLEAMPSGTCTGVADVITYYVRGSGGKVLAEYYRNNADEYYCRYKYIYAGDQRIAMVDEDNKVHYYLSDHLGSARVVFGEQPFAINDKYSRYWAFGDDKGASIQTAQPHRYTGMPFDNESGLGLYYYGARYYDAVLGRFVAVDPLAAKYPGLSPYVYCANNPLKYVDPDGRKIYYASQRLEEATKTLRAESETADENLRQFDDDEGPDLYIQDSKTDADESAIILGNTERAPTGFDEDGTLTFGDVTINVDIQDVDYLVEQGIDVDVADIIGYESTHAAAVGKDPIKYAKDKGKKVGRSNMKNKPFKTDKDAQDRDKKIRKERGRKLKTSKELRDAYKEHKDKLKEI